MAVRIGPASSALVLDWTASTRDLVGRFRENAHRLGIAYSEHALDLCDTVIDTWAGNALLGPTFDWSYDSPVEVFRLITDAWLTIGSLADEQLASRQKFGHFACTSRRRWISSNTCLGRRPTMR